jgi:hypothetical protein
VEIVEVLEEDSEDVEEDVDVAVDVAMVTARRSGFQPPSLDVLCSREKSSHWSRSISSLCQ